MQLTGASVPIESDAPQNVPRGPPSSLRDTFSPPSELRLRVSGVVPRLGDPGSQGG